MPPKKVKKKGRVPHANETPLKHTQPGHGAVERAKNQMWATDSSTAATSTAAAAHSSRPAYKAKPISGMGGIGIGRGTGRAVCKKKASTSATTRSIDSNTADTDSTKPAPTTDALRSNPDADFFAAKPTTK